jgi:hypothetical protein
MTCFNEYDIRHNELQYALEEEFQGIELSMTRRWYILPNGDRSPLLIVEAERLVPAMQTRTVRGIRVEFYLRR